MNDMDIEIEEGQDYNMDEVDDMPSFVNEIDGVYKCDLTVKRETGEKDGKPTDTLMFQFTIEEEVEVKKDHGVKPDDIVMIRYSLIKSKKDEEEKRKEAAGLRMAKPLVLALKAALDTSSALNDIIKAAQGVKCTVTFSTRTSGGKDVEGNAVVYKNPQVKKLIVL